MYAQVCVSILRPFRRDVASSVILFPNKAENVFRQSFGGIDALQESGEARTRVIALKTSRV